MIKRIIISSIFCLVAVLNSNACMLCGCSATNQYLGILPPSKSSFVGLQYVRREFTSIHEDELDAMGNKMKATEYYNTLQIWGKYNISNSVQVFAFIPYTMNTQMENSVKTTANGLSDITLLANVRVLGNKCTGHLIEHGLQIGGGVKLPTGRYDIYAVRHGESLPNMQPGTRSYDFVANANYTVTRKMLGLNLDGSFTLTTQNPENYKYGNRLSTGLVAFYIIKNKQANILPQIGMRCDVTGKDYDNYTQRWVSQDMLGGHQFYATVGVQAYYHHIGLQLSAFKPLWQHFAGNLVQNKYRAEAGFYFLF